MSEIGQIGAAALAWALWGVAHSLTASNRFKQAVSARFGLRGSSLRRLYNVFALVSLIPVLWFSWQVTRSSPKLIEFAGVAAFLPWTALAVALVIFVDSLRAYNAREFAGLAEEDREAKLSFSTSHRFVRHPWYFAILLILWVRDLTIAGLVVNAVLTLYLVFGTRLEERRLAETHSLWRTYAKSVPMLLPWPRRYLTTDQLSGLISQSESSV